MKAKQCFGRAYIRRMNHKDRGESITVAMKMAAVEAIQKRHNKVPYVIVRHGFPNVVLAAGYSKNELKTTFNVDWHSASRFFQVGK